MTPEQLTGLGLLLLELRDWLEELHPGSLDSSLIDAAVDVCARARQELVTGGAS